MNDLKNVHLLCIHSDPYTDKLPPELFTQAMGEIIKWHQKKSSFYQNFLSDNGFFLEAWDGDLKKIPYIPAEFFKYHEIKSIEDNDVFIHLTSSGTTGQKSQMFFDEWSLKSAQQMVTFIFKHYGWVSTEESNYLLYTYQTEQDSSLGTAYTDNFLTQFSPIHEVDFALKLNGKGGHEFDLMGCIRTLKKYELQRLPVRIFGFPSFFYFTLKRMKELKMQPLKLSLDSLVFLGGGWKGFSDQSIEKTELYQLAEEMLSLPQRRLRDGFGSVEHCVPYIECEKHHFHIPIYSRVLIRDMRSLQVIGYDQKGFLQFISPYITSAPAHSVLMGDKAVLRRAKDCACGLNTDWFEILGRAGTSKNRSCALQAAELLKEFQ